MILIIDNYDSFTYNLYQQVGGLGFRAKVVKNDEIDTASVDKIQPSHIIISPGPKRPENSGISLEVIKSFYKRIPVLGVCLGHQAIGAAFGGKVIRAPELMHGKTSKIHHDSRTIFRDLPQDFEATRYHSLIVERKSLPAAATCRCPHRAPPALR